MYELGKVIALLPAEDLTQKEAKKALRNCFDEGYPDGKPEILAVGVFDIFPHFTICVLKAGAGRERECIRHLHKRGIMAFRMKAQKNVPGHRERLKVRLAR